MSKQESLKMTLYNITGDGPDKEKQTAWVDILSTQTDN